MPSLQVYPESLQCPGQPSPAPTETMANLSDSAALVMGTIAKNIMEGSAAIFGQLIRSQFQVQ